MKRMNRPLTINEQGWPNGFKAAVEGSVVRHRLEFTVWNKGVCPFSRNSSTAAGGLHMSVLGSYVERRCPEKRREGGHHFRLVHEEGWPAPDRVRQRVGVVQKHGRKKRIVEHGSAYE